MRFWPFHKHQLDLVGKTVSLPKGVTSFNGELLPAFEKVIHGCTSFVWKCNDKQCPFIKTVTVLGIPEKKKENDNV